jgi:hypothetical protein
MTINSGSREILTKDSIETDKLVCVTSVIFEII